MAAVLSRGSQGLGVLLAPEHRGLGGGDVGGEEEAELLAPDGAGDVELAGLVHQEGGRLAVDVEAELGA